MIGYLRGRALPGNLVLTGGDVGYLVHTPAPLTAGENVELYVTTVVREDAITLYGFASAPEQELFTILIKVQGVGPGVALALLRDVGPGPLVAALTAEQAQPLTAAAGVGLKKAQTIVTMARGKVPAALVALFTAEQAGPAEVPAGPQQDVVNTLTAMGFTELAATEAVAAIAADDPGATESVLLRRALTALNRAA